MTHIPKQKKVLTNPHPDSYAPPKKFLVCSVVEFCKGNKGAVTPEGGGKRARFEPIFGKECEALFSEEKGFSVKRGEAIQ